MVFSPTFTVIVYSLFSVFGSRPLTLCEIENISVSLPIRDSKPQAVHMTRHIPTDPVLCNALPADTKIPDPVNEKFIINTMMVYV